MLITNQFINLINCGNEQVCIKNKSSVNLFIKQNKESIEPFANNLLKKLKIKMEIAQKLDQAQEDKKIFVDKQKTQQKFQKMHIVTHADYKGMKLEMDQLENTKDGLKLKGISTINLDNRIKELKNKIETITKKLQKIEKEAVERSEIKNKISAIIKYIITKRKELRLKQLDYERSKLTLLNHVKDLLLSQNNTSLTADCVMYHIYTLLESQIKQNK